MRANFSPQLVIFRSVVALGYFTILAAVVMIPFLSATKETFQSVVWSRFDHSWRLLNKEQCVKDAGAWYRFEDYQAWRAAHLKINLQLGYLTESQELLRESSLATVIKEDTDARPEWRSYGMFATRNNRWYQVGDFDIYWASSCMNVPLSQYVRLEDNLRKQNLEDYCRSAKPIDPSEHALLRGGSITCSSLGLH